MLLGKAEEYDVVVAHRDQVFNVASPWLQHQRKKKFLGSNTHYEEGSHST